MRLIFALLGLIGFSAASCTGSYDADTASLYKAKLATKANLFSNGGYLSFKKNAGSSAEWSVNNCDEGDFVVSFRYSLKKGTKPFDLSVNGKVVSSNFSPAATGKNNWSISKQQLVTLKAGRNSIQIVTSGDKAPYVDYMLISEVPEPLENADCSGIYEAEAAGVVYHGMKVKTGKSGFSGSGYAKFKHKKGDFILWELPACLSGTYSVAFHYSLKKGDRNLGLDVNTKRYPVTFTKSKNSLVDTAAQTVTLTAGVNFVELTTTGKKGVTIDYVKLKAIELESLDIPVTSTELASAAASAAAAVTVDGLTSEEAVVSQEGAVVLATFDDTQAVVVLARQTWQSDNELDETTKASVEEAYCVAFAEATTFSGIVMEREALLCELSASVTRSFSLLMVVSASVTKTAMPTPAPSPSPTPAPTKAVVVPTPAPTKAVVVPTPAPTKATVVAPTPAPTKATVVAPTPAPTATPGNNDGWSKVSDTPCLEFDTPGNPNFGPESVQSSREACSAHCETEGPKQQEPTSYRMVEYVPSTNNCKCFKACWTTGGMQANPVQVWAKPCGTMSCRECIKHDECYFNAGARPWGFCSEGSAAVGAFEEADSQTSNGAAVCGVDTEPFDPGSLQEFVGVPLSF